MLEGAEPVGRNGSARLDLDGGDRVADRVQQIALDASGITEDREIRAVALIGAVLKGLCHHGVLETCLAFSMPTRWRARPTS